MAIVYDLGSLVVIARFTRRRSTNPCLSLRAAWTGVLVLFLTAQASVVHDLFCCKTYVVGSTSQVRGTSHACRRRDCIYDTGATQVRSHALR